MTALPQSRYQFQLLDLRRLGPAQPLFDRPAFSLRDRHQRLCTIPIKNHSTISAHVVIWVFELVMKAGTIPQGRPSGRAPGKPTLGRKHSGIGLQFLQLCCRQYPTQRGRTVPSAALASSRVGNEAFAQAARQYFEGELFA
jgi:hypothetical protein